MTFLAHLADRVLNRPLLITPEKAQVILSVLANRIGVNTPSADRFEGSRYSTDENGEVTRLQPYKLRSDGVAIISIVGTLVNRGAYIGASSGVVSYEGIKHQLKHAASNAAVKAVIVDIQTPGGEAIGAFETAEQVRFLAREKRTIAVVNGMAASAGYAIASGATEIVTTETGVSGSIGVVLLHADYSRFLANEGIDPTLIFAGAHKVDGNPFEPLSDGVREDLQAEVEAIYEGFLATVEQGRGRRLTREMARATEARTFIGTAAVSAGLADRLGTFETVLESLSASLPSARSGRNPSQTRRSLTMSENAGAPAAETQAGIPQADHERAVDAARMDGEKAGAVAERERLSAVLGADGVKGDGKRMTAALELAAKSPGMSSKEVAAFVTANVASAMETKPDASLESRASDADPLGQHAPSTGKQESGLSRLVTRRVKKMTA